MVYPAKLLVSYLACQLLLLAWSAFPAATMKGAQPLESWLFLAGGMTLFVSWIWPMARPGRLGWRQAGLEAALLLIGSVPAAAVAVLLVDAPLQQVLSPAGYGVAWLAAGAAAATAGPAVRWLYCLLLAVGNLGLLGLGYLWLDLLGSDPSPLWRLSPMYQASRLAEIGWPTMTPDRLASLAPVCVLLALLVANLLPGRRDELSADLRSCG